MLSISQSWNVPGTRAAVRNVAFDDVGRGQPRQDLVMQGLVFAAGDSGPPAGAVESASGGKIQRLQ